MGVGSGAEWVEMEQPPSFPPKEVGDQPPSPVEYDPDTKPVPVPSAPPVDICTGQNVSRKSRAESISSNSVKFEQDVQKFIANDLHATIADESTDSIPLVDPNTPPPDGYKISHIAAPVPDILQQMIDDKRDVHSTSIGGQVIPSHQVGFTIKGGKLEVLAPGRRRLWHPQRDLVSPQGADANGLVDINSESIKVGNWHFIRVLPGEMGLGLLRGQPHILEEGRHLMEAPDWKYVGKAKTTDFDVTFPECPALRIIRVRPGHMALLFENGAPKWLPARQDPYELLQPLQEFVALGDLMQDVIQMDDENTLDIVRVRPGCIGLAWQDSRPVILSEGLYELRAPRHQFVKLHSAMEEEIRLDDSNSLDIVRVLPGKVGLVWEHSQPRLLMARTDPYILKKPAQQFVRLMSLETEHINLSSLHIITLKTGTRGVVWVNGTACIIEEGQHCFMENNFIFGGSQDLSTKHYQLGPFIYVTVDAGEVGVKHTSGHLEVLTAGTHIIRTQDGETFTGFISIQQQVMLIEDLAVRTSDNVDLTVDAVLTYKITDPQKALGDVKNLNELLRQRSFTTLSNIFAHINYSEKAVPIPMVRDDGTSAPPAYGQEPQYEMNTEVQKEFLHSIQATSLQDWGVHITDLSVDNIKVVSQALAEDLKQRALVTIQTENAQKNAEAKRRVDLMNAEKEVDQLKFQAEGKQVQAIAEAEAQAKAKIAVAEADAEAQQKRNLMAIEQAKAEAEATRIRAEAKAMKRLDENALKVRMWEAQVEMAKEMFKNQRTFVDTSSMPNVAELLNLSAVTNMGLLPSVTPPQNPTE